MVREIQFNSKNFEKKDDYNLLGPLTKNTIILCSNWNIMNLLAKEIFDTINGNAEYNDYYCDDKDIGNAIFELRFGLQMKIKINNQTITLALEPAIVYKAKRPEDIWLFDCTKANQGFIYPMLIYKGSRRIWKKGLDEVYKMICSGRYGCYNGEWTNLRNVEYDSEYRVINSRII